MCRTCRSSLVLQAFVYGDSLQAQLVAVVVPDPETLLPWARERNLPQVSSRRRCCSLLFVSWYGGCRAAAWGRRQRPVGRPAVGATLDDVGWASISNDCLCTTVVRDVSAVLCAIMVSCVHAT
jgi:hypothetical protein